MDVVSLISSAGMSALVALLVAGRVVVRQENARRRHAALHAIREALAQPRRELRMWRSGLAGSPTQPRRTGEELDLADWKILAAVLVEVSG